MGKMPHGLPPPCLDPHPPHAVALDGGASSTLLGPHLTYLPLLVTMHTGHFEGADLPEDAMLTTMPVAPGDIIVLGR